MPLTLAGAALGAGAISGASSLAGSLINAYTSNKWASKNLAFQKNQFQYQKYLNELQMSREDTAFQRAVADARAAGLSPLAVSSGAVTGDLSSTAFSGVGNNAGQIDTGSISNALNSALGVYQAGLQREQQNNNNAATSADIAFKLAQSQASNAQTAFLNEQSKSISLDNAFKTATMQSRIDEQDAKTKQYGLLAQEIAARTDLTKSEKSKVLAEVGLLETQSKTYGDYLAEQLQSARLANASQTIKNDVLRLDRLFRNADWNLYNVDKQLDWSSRNKTLFGQIFGDLQSICANLQNAFSKRPDTSWFREY